MKLAIFFQQAFAAIWAGELNWRWFPTFHFGIGRKMLSGREISILRAYARYMRQSRFPIQPTIY
ncbi:NAD-glutamate dehydrogenase [Vibrio chagasii]|nr:NAD-glutamate dehydrogenase [Vibrio chagasii]